MSLLTLELLAERVAVLEQVVLRGTSSPTATLTASSRSKDWRRTIGFFADDEMMKEIFALGREIREEERCEPRP